MRRAEPGWSVPRIWFRVVLSAVTLLVLAFGCRRARTGLGPSEPVGDAGGDAGSSGAAQIAGNVRDAVTGEGIPGATVRLREARTFSSTAVISTITEGTPPGSYELSETLPDGLIRASVSAVGYEDLVTYRSHVIGDATAPSAVAPITVAHDFELWPSGSLHELLPDLVPDPRNLEASRVLLTNRCDGRPESAQCLRLAVGVANVGHGDLYLSADPADLGSVTQHVSRSDGEMVEASIEGAFEHHPEHHHLHFGGWAQSLLRRVTPACDMPATAASCPIARRGEKISFCIRNSIRVDAAFIPRRPFDCVLAENGRVEQGISAGYMDIYTQNFIGQMVDVTGLSSGEYWLETEVNPDRVAIEQRYDNNVARARHRLELPTCGDGSIDPPESCEDANLDGQTCESVDERFVSGALACTADCGFDLADCEAAMCEPENIGSATGTVSNGSNEDARNTTDPSRCTTPAGTGKDVAFRWTAPEAGRYHFVDTVGAMMLSVRSDSCDGAELACITERTAQGVEVTVGAGDDLVIVLDVPPGVDTSYALVIDGPG